MPRNAFNTIHHTTRIDKDTMFSILVNALDESDTSQEEPPVSIADILPTDAFFRVNGEEKNLLGLKLTDKVLKSAALGSSDSPMAFIQLSNIIRCANSKFKKLFNAAFALNGDSGSMFARENKVYVIVLDWEYEYRNELTVEDDVGIVAVMNLVKVSESTVLLDSIAVFDGWRGKGIGTSLLNSVISYAKNGCFEKILLFSPQSLMYYFAEFGFEDRSIESSGDLKKMVLDLP
ncbi:hypothetical protein BKA69DRAFT_767474 [Paraphysoderma sedebokerense]|nr:hypothetical protein BKA69DRAFT_767474 [Paraphysoderma sedebokerense]